MSKISTSTKYEWLNPNDSYTDFKRKTFAKTFKEPRVPNTSTKNYGSDVVENFKMGVKGGDTFTSHLVQDYNWLDHDFNYDWNDFGFRGPNPNFNSKTKILYAGGSMMLGTGVPVENSFTHLFAEKMGCDYLNMSDFDCMSDLIPPLRTLGREYNPDYLILNDTRFIQESGWVLNYILRSTELDKEQKHFYKDMLLTSGINFLVMFESFLYDMFPNTKIVFLWARYRKHFKNAPAWEKITNVIYSPNDMVDLARDNRHPGIKSHIGFANRLINEI